MRPNLHRLRIASAVVLTGLFCSPLIAGPDATNPSTEATTTAPTPTHLSATVTGVKGLVQYREGADAAWQPCKVGLTLNEGAEFQTGPRSNVQLLVAPQQTITLDRLGSMTLLEAVQQAGKFKTNVGLKHGRVRYQIEAAGIEHESTVSSPNGTLAVRDTSFAVDDEQPFPPEAYRLSGTVEFTTAKRQISIGGNQLGHVKAVGDQDPANTQLSLAVVDPSAALSRSSAETPLVSNLLSRSAVLTETQIKGIPTVSGGYPPSDTALPNAVPGDLDFVLRWDGPANLNLGLINLAKGETLYPVTSLNTSPSGGIIPFNDIGGPHGGIELAYWEGAYAKGIYQMVVYNASGVPVTYKLGVLEHKQHDPIFTSTTAGSQGVSILTGTISQGQVVAGIVEVGGGSIVPPTPPGTSSVLTGKLNGERLQMQPHHR